MGAAYTTILGDESLDTEERRKAKAAAGQPAEMPDEVAFTKVPPPKPNQTLRAQAVTPRAQAAAPCAQAVTLCAQAAAPCVQAVATCTQAPHVDAFPSWAGRLASWLHHLGGERLDAWLMPSYSRIIYQHVRPRAERAALAVPPLATPAAARDARLWVWAALRTPEARLSRTDPSGSMWCCRQPAPTSLSLRRHRSACAREHLWTARCVTASCPRPWRLSRR